MNTTISEAVSLVRNMCARLDAVPNVEKAVCPPYVSLAPVREAVEGSSIKIGAQNMHFEEKGAYTGEVSPLMLQDLCHYVIIGHSERRSYFHETNELVNKKVKAALKYGLVPIMCVGERIEENEAGKTEEIVSDQVLRGLDGATPTDIVIAYEPIWAIGTGRAATCDQAQETMSVIRSRATQILGEEFGQRIRILYGGSVTPSNIADMLSRPDIDGALVGGASLKAADFISIVEQSAAATKR